MREIVSMALYSFNGRNISYQADFAAFNADLLLLQGARFNSDYWRPVRAFLEDTGPKGSHGSSRVVTCDWYDSKLSPQELADGLKALCKTLGLVSVHVVALEEAIDPVDLAGFEKTLIYRKTIPTAEDLARAIGDFLRT